MSREITIITPENATITYEMAGLGSRGAAFIIDSLIQGIVVIVLLLITAVATGTMKGGLGSDRFMSSIGDFWTGILILSIFIITFGYFIYTEAKHNGQTIGKRCLGLRVIREEGTPVDFSAAAIRNLIRIIELSTLPFIGIISVLFSPMYKRLGDYAAGTIVVKERSAGELPRIRPMDLRAVSTPEAEYVKDVDLLTKEEFAVVRRFVERRVDLNKQVQESVAKQISGPIMARLSIGETSGQFSYSNFLEEVYKRYVDERGAL